MAYLPDDLPYGSSGDCLENLFKLLHDRGLQQVDYAITHGYFRHVLPKGATREPECVYTAEQFSPFVRRRVVSGHVHTSSSYNDFVYYNGSFSRLNHGEEEDKGFWVFEDSSSKLTSRFVVNKEAPPFYTFDLSKTKDRDAAIEVFLSRMKKKFRTQEDFGFVRVVHQSGEIIKTIAKVCSTKYPNIVYTHKTIDGSVAQAQVAMCQIAPLTDRPIPTKENLPDLLSTFLSKQQINRSAEEIRACLQTLQ
jgi:DNA repair exonuclease SbcCD nuclease subunit